jgi:hypothetical protein
MPDITVTVDVRDAQAKLSAFARNQLPFALTTAVNSLAFDLMRAENAHIAKVFKHPRPFTQRATQVEKKARKGDPTAIVSVRADRAKYLQPYEFGGVHKLPGTALLNPKDVDLDQYGQLTKNKIKKLLARPDCFAATIRGISGVWQRIRVVRVAVQPGWTGQPPAGAGRLRLLIRFGNALPVHQQLRWLDTATGMVAAQWPKAFDAAMAKAIATAKL